MSFFNLLDLISKLYFYSKHFRIKHLIKQFHSDISQSNLSTIRVLSFLFVHFTIFLVNEANTQCWQKCQLLTKWVQKCLHLLNITRCFKWKFSTLSFSFGIFFPRMACSVWPNLRSAIISLPHQVRVKVPRGCTHPITKGYLILENCPNLFTHERTFAKRFYPNVTRINLNDQCYQLCIAQCVNCTMC